MYDICLKCGDNGKDASDLYSDPRALGNIYAGPYIYFEPESAFVLEDAEGVCGYILSTKNTMEFYDKYVSLWLPSLRNKYPEPTGEFSNFSPDENVYHQYHHPDNYIIKDIEDYPAHLHIDLLPRAQRMGNGKSLMNTLIKYQKTNHVPGLHLGVGEINYGAITFYKKMGFTELERHDDVIFMGKKF